MRLGKFATVNPRYSASEPAVTRRNTVSPVQTTGKSPGSTPDVCSRASMDGSSSGLSRSCGTRLRVRYSRMRRVSGENREPTSRRDAAALLSRSARRAMNAFRMVSLSLVSVASKCWSACLETTTTSPGSTTRESIAYDVAVAYRATHAVDDASVRLAVVVQRMVDADVAGVLFTADPIKGTVSGSGSSTSTNFCRE